MGHMGVQNVNQEVQKEGKKKKMSECLQATKEGNRSCVFPL